MDHFVGTFKAWHGPWAYAAIFGLLASCGFGLPVNEDIVILGSAVLTFYGVFQVPFLIPAILLGLLVGDSMIFNWGHRYGETLIEKKPFSYLMSPEKLAAARARFKGGGAGLLLLTRFLPGVRAPIHFSAGTLKISWRTFLLCDFCAGLVEVPVLVYAVRFVGGHVDKIMPYFKTAQYLLLAVVAVWWALKMRRVRMTARGRG